MVVDKILIIDDEYEQVKALVQLLNGRGISIDFKEDPLANNVMISEYTQMVVLDLYMNKIYANFDYAIETVMFLSENIAGPYFIVLWSKQPNEINNFKIEIDNLVMGGKIVNPPVEITNLKSNKLASADDGSTNNEVVEELLSIIEKMKDKHADIFSFLEITTMFRNKSASIWRMIKNHNRRDKFDNLEQLTEINSYQISVLFQEMDKCFNYEKSGKGMVMLQSKILENGLTMNPIKYNEPKEKIGNIETIKNEVNHKLRVSRIEENRCITEDYKPGTIGVVFRKKKIQKMKEMYIVKSAKLEASIVKSGELYITPYCDYSNNKRENRLVLPIILLLTEESDCKKVKKIFKENVNFKQIYWKDIIGAEDFKENLNHNECFDQRYNCYLAYIPKEVFTNNHKRRKMIYNFYLNKDLVNEIQMDVSTSISRPGIPSI